MITDINSEDRLVQGTFAGHLETALGWESFYAWNDETFGPDGMLELAKSEFDVLEVFLKRANRLLTRTAISEAIGLSEDPDNSRAIDIRIMRLRKKIEEDPGNPRFLRTVRGEGYIFSLPGEEAAEH